MNAVIFPPSGFSCPPLPAFVLAQVGSNLIVNGVLVAALAGGVLFAVCRSSRRN